MSFAPIQKQVDDWISQFAEGDMAAEIADAIFVLVCMANAQGIDLDDAFGSMMEKYRQRDGDPWTKKT